MRCERGRAHYRADNHVQSAVDWSLFTEGEARVCILSETGVGQSITNSIERAVEAVAPLIGGSYGVFWIEHYPAVRRDRTGRMPETFDLVEFGPNGEPIWHPITRANLDQLISGLSKAELPA